MKAYKGFNRDMTCRGYQYEEGKSYEEERAELCKSGFHACEHPLGCFGHYRPASSVYHEVELEDVSPKSEDDTKRVGKRITIGERLSIAGMVKAAVDYVFGKADWSSAAEHATGYQGVACALGIGSRASGAIGCWIVCAEWKEVKPFEWHRVDVRCVQVDGEKIKPNVWYKLKNGEFVEAGEDE